MKIRSSGILLHISSLPSRFGIGDLGPEAYRFADFLAESNQRIWQILPLNPTDRSPYHSESAFAANPMLISPEQMVEAGFLEASDIGSPIQFTEGRVDFAGAYACRRELLECAWKRFDPQFPGYRQFVSEHADWLEDYSLFRALKQRFNLSPWTDWPTELRDRHTGALEKAAGEYREVVEKEKFFQFVFHHQWTALKRHCNEKGIHIFGDIPIYVTYDSVDVWAHPDIFKLDQNRRPTVVAGVPPDYFSRTGQLWGNPVYNWNALRDTRYAWWMQRFRRNRELFDLVRIDHFRGLVAYWEVPVSERNAINGRWVEAPALDFFEELCRRFPNIPVLAEDLGYITADVREVVARFGFPGMKILLFAFGQDMPTNPYIPHNLPENCVAYTGTHDNNTLRGWFENETSEEDRQRIFRYIGRHVPAEELHWEFIRLLMRSAARIVIFPIQDVLGLGGDARMNYPGEHSGNWDWRLSPGMLGEDPKNRLADMTKLYGRA